jgi:hypothetical protein
VATSHKFFVIKTEDWVVRVQEFRVEDDLDPIRASVEELDSSDLVQNRICAVILHIVGDNWRKRTSLEGKDSPLQSYLVGIQ